MVRLFAILILCFAAPASAQQPSADDVHAFERDLHGYGDLRPGRNGDKSAPDAANFDEDLVGDLVPPALFTSAAQANDPQAWNKRRTELADLIEDNWTGRIPEAVKGFRIIWTKSADQERTAANAAEHWLGQVISADGRSGPNIDAVITFPANSAAAASVIEYTFIWPPGFSFPGPPAPDTKQMTLDRGLVHVAYRVQLLQADTAAEMQQGIIGLARWPRQRHDWGALRAWAWGASQLRAQLARDPRIDGSRISLAGHSRFGKAVLVAAAFDHKFADALVSSSGAGGAKLMRRDFGEHWYNMAGSYAYHWYTPQVMQFAGRQDVADLPVDAHMLIALRAPHPMLISSGLAEKGDDWVDPRGMWIATGLAAPAWAAYDLPVPPQGDMPPVMEGYTEYPLAFFQHDQGHVMWAAWQAFLDHAERYATGQD